MDLLAPKGLIPSVPKKQNKKLVAILRWFFSSLEWGSRGNKLKTFGQYRVNWEFSGEKKEIVFATPSVGEHRGIRKKLLVLDTIEHNYFKKSFYEFDHYFQATVQFPLSNAGNRTRGCWIRK